MTERVAEEKLSTKFLEGKTRLHTLSAEKDKIKKFKSSVAT